VGRGSLNPEALTPFQTSLVDGWSKADIVIVLAPEYNWTTSGELLDLLHVSAGPAFSGALFGNKVFGIVGVSSGRGGRMPAVEVSTVVNKLVSFTNNISVVSPKILESHETAANLDADGVFVGTAAIYDKTARDFVAYTTNIATRWQCEVPA
jgi:chromate reductase